MKKIIIPISLFVFFVASCGGGESTENTTGEDTVQACTYSYDSSSTVISWTAFKLTEKVGVTGYFDQASVIAKENQTDMFAVLNGATFEIPVSSLNSQDPVRDGKLKNSFFGNMTETEYITGVVNSISANEASINMNMNGHSKDVNGNVIVDGEKITVTATIDILDWDGQVPMDSLSLVCAEKHTGPDGINKLWSTVEVAVSTTLVKTCK